MLQDDTHTPFASALELKHERYGEYTTIFPSSFCFGSRAHGGLLLSLVQRSAVVYFESSPDKPNQPDVLDLKLYFFRPSLAGEIKIVLQDDFISKQSSTVEVKVYQDKKLKMIGLINMGNFNTLHGSSFDTHWSLKPAPAQASIPQLASDSDSLWISYQCPWHPQGYRRPQSYVKVFVPVQLQDPSFRDSWLTPSDPTFTFKNEHLGFVGDMTLPILDNFCGESGVRSHAVCIRVGLQQKRDREEGGIERIAEAESESSTTPVVLVMLSFNMEIKKRLPDEGTRWLFSRSRARQIMGVRMDNETTILDELGELVAIVQQVQQVYEVAINAKL